MVTVMDYTRAYGSYNGDSLEAAQAMVKGAIESWAEDTLAENWKHDTGLSVPEVRIEFR